MTEKDPESFTGRVAIVVGAARGIGAEIAALLSARGATVARADILPAHEWRDDLAERHTRHTVDIRSADSCRKLVAEVLEAHGRLDHVVNSAAIMRRSPAASMAENDFGDVLDANVTGSFRICQAGYEALRGSRGSIVLLSSTNGHIAVRNKVGYASSKAAIIHMARLLALEWAADGIRVNTVAPTLTATEMTKDLRDDPVQLAEKMASIPLGRMAEPRDVANAAAFLLSPSAAMITGQTLFVDGGATLQ